jgi:hypothetical protein
MTYRTTIGDAAAEKLERRWFAAQRAASQVRGECETLLEVRAMADEAWRSARLRLAELEALRDALGDELASLEERDHAEAAVADRKEMTAA